AVLRPMEMTSSNGAALALQADGSVLASGAEGKTVYTLTADLPPGAAVGGLRLEALTDAALAANGPGRSGNGNFVLTELEATLQAPGEATPQPLAFADASATFNQGSFDVKTAIDGHKTDAVNGWAIHPKGSMDQTAVFVLKTPPAGGGRLTVRLHQNYDGKHTLGKFRLSTTAQTAPLNFGVPGGIISILAIAPEQRSPEQKTALTTYVQTTDPERAKLTADLAAARIPLPEDPQITAGKAALATAEIPVPADPKLERLSHDVELSAAQLKAQRLTAAQDLTWALINTPAFLFNH
ncbi:MAG: hypothetical protein JWM59_4385, partial [Verrucomicrobiales bacterium]|nr:hypothetical protein [Verrucomicrobiales bacterium]